jgi:hypothetical protein
LKSAGNIKFQYLGIGLSVAGAISDFISGSLILASSMASSYDNMTMTYSYNVQDLAWAVLLFVLGGLILITGVISLSSFGMKNMRGIGSIMAIFGAIMIGSGLIMAEGMSPSMMGFTDRSAIGVAMFVIGALMIVNGFWMAARRNRFRRMETTSMPSRDKKAEDQRTSTQSATS